MRRVPLRDLDGEAVGVVLVGVRVSPPECGSIMVVVRGAPRESLNLRVPPELKAEVERFAEVKGVSINAAAILLLVEGVRSERRRK